MSRSDETSGRARGMRLDAPRSLVLGVVLGAVSLALVSAPAFAVERHSGKNIAPVLDTDHKRMYRTNLREAAKRAPDFAGRFVLTHWGCGSSCREWALINVATGAVMFPDVDKMGNRKDAPYPAWGVEVAEAKADSRFLILDGYRPGGFARHVWSFDGRRFHHVHSKPREPNEAEARALNAE